ncbi:MAG: bifunctional aspartate kinase/homoserine dehydrogenase I, partial [Bacteroidales bacterium]|nr:bifunctional aspartate kinase/homoserine dehydrogenase I [Bacteroidales bacterium]
MIVLKFGGSSVGSVDSIQKMMQIVSNYPADEQLVVVVSAMQGVTNLLEAAGHYSMSNPKGYIDHINKIESIHQKAIEALVDDSEKAEVLNFVQSVCREAADICKGVEILKEYSDKAKARLVGIGERLSSRLISAAFRAIGVDNEWLSSAEFVITDDRFTNAKVNMKVSGEKARDIFSSINKLAIVPGFLATTASGDMTTLGRGGSDYTAALIGNFLDAKQVDIWTDVDGVLTASPQMVSSAYSIPHLSYEEAMELSYFGAKVLYSSSVSPCMQKDIPIRVKNTFNPDFEGTLISRAEDKEGAVVKGFSSVDHISLITVSGSGMIGVPGIAMRVFKALSERNINVLLITQSSSEHTISLGVVGDDRALAVQQLDAEFQVEMGNGKMRQTVSEDDLSIVAIVGDKMRESAGVSGKALRQLGLNGINIRAIAQGGTERNISVVINEKQTRKALNVLHDGFFLSKYRKIHLYAVGVGTVGSTMLAQLRDQAEYLKAEYQIDVRLVGVANSRKMLFDAAGIDLHNYKELLDTAGEVMDLTNFVQRINEQNLRHCIFVDNTASYAIPKIYKAIAEQNVSIVASNKVMASSPLAELEDFKATLKQKGLKFLNETNVGAGLPILKTIEDLVAAGDKIVKIQAVLSGSLNYIFNTISATLPFSQAVIQARELGLTEPDPSIDLSGLDVMRKILILARVGGNKMELEEVSSKDIIPKEDMETASFEDLLVNLRKNDAAVELIRKTAAD